jgi:branched-chain amino acid aminotransferase
MSDPVAYLNGQWVPQAHMALPVSDAGFVMGATVVDFVRTFRHQLDRWPEHLRRFRQNIHDAPIDNFHCTDEELAGVAHELTRRNASLLGPHQELVLILFATPGPIGYYAGAAGPANATLGMHTFPLPFERYRDMIRRGAWLRVASVRALPPECVPPNIKHRSRLHWWRAEQDVAKIDGGESKALLLNAAGHVTETSFANIVIVRGRDLISPRRSTILPGLSLQMIEDLCPEAGLRFRESDLTVADCLSADAMLLGGTAFCLARVERLNDTVLPSSDVLNRLLSAWNKRVGVDIHAQILGP